MPPVSAISASRKTTPRHETDGRDRASAAEKQQQAQEAARKRSAEERKAAREARETRQSEVRQSDAKRAEARQEARRREARADALAPREPSVRGRAVTVTPAEARLVEVKKGELPAHVVREQLSHIAAFNARKGYNEARSIFGPPADKTAGQLSFARQL